MALDLWLVFLVSSKISHICIIPRNSSCGALAGTRNSLMCPIGGIDPMTHCSMSGIMLLIHDRSWISGGLVVFKNEAS